MLKYLDPSLWSEWEVNHWLEWCQTEFGLHYLGSDLKGLQGSELCGLDRETFLGLMSDCTAGEILWEHLEIMRKGKKGIRRKAWRQHECMTCNLQLFSSIITSNSGFLKMI